MCWTFPHHRPHRLRRRRRRPSLRARSLRRPPPLSIPDRRSGRRRSPPRKIRIGKRSRPPRSNRPLSRKDPIPHLRRTPAAVRPAAACPPAARAGRPGRPERSNPRPAAPDGPSPCRSSRPSGRRLFAGAGPCWWCSMSGGRSIWPNSVQTRRSGSAAVQLLPASTVIRVPAPPGAGNQLAANTRTPGSSHRGPPLRPASPSIRAWLNSGSCCRPTHREGSLPSSIPTPARTSWWARSVRPARASPPPGGRPNSPCCRLAGRRGRATFRPAHADRGARRVRAVGDSRRARLGGRAGERGRPGRRPIRSRAASIFPPSPRPS